jgi:putative N6-adenine-specific DNA methylase
VRAARRNAERAGCAGAIHFAAAPFEALRPPAARGLLVLDPPYGRRLGSPRGARAAYARLGRALLPRWTGWRLGVLAPSAALLEGLPGRRVAEHLLPHGGLRVTLRVLDLG